MGVHKERNLLKQNFSSNLLNDSFRRVQGALHCVKRVRTRCYFDPHFPLFGHFLRSGEDESVKQLYAKWEESWQGKCIK